MGHRFVVEDTSISPQAPSRESHQAAPSTVPAVRDNALAPPGLDAGARDDRLSAQLRGAVAQRALVHRPVLQRNEESAKLLTELAVPTVRPGPTVPVQKALVDKLDVEHEEVFRGGAINLGGILIEDWPPSYKELVEQAQLTALPKIVSGSPYRYISFGGLSRAAKVKELGFDRLLVENTLATMLDARQLEYLQLAGLPNDEWKILIELHYFRERDMSATGFHKDTLGQTIFVNLNYHMGEALGKDEMLIGPEIVVNPPVSATHHAQTKASLPKEFRKDLKATRAKLDDPTTIDTQLVDPYGYVAFVDEAVHHATPLYGHRYVTPGELKAYLAQAYPAAFTEATRAYAKFTGQRLGSWWHYEFPSYVTKSIIGEDEIAKWQTLMQIVADPDAKRRITRNDVKGTISSDEFDDVLEFAGTAKLDGQRGSGRAAGFHAASIPGVGVGVSAHESPVAPGRRKLKRTLSTTDFRKTLPPEPAAHVKRRFFRTWVRAIPKDMADELPRRLRAEAEQERALAEAQALAKAQAEEEAKAKLETTVV